MNEYRPYTFADKFVPSEFVPDFVLVAGTSNRPLFEAVGKSLAREVDFCTSTFPNNEILASISHSVRGNHVFILNSTGYPKPNDYLMETLEIADAAKRSSADEITAVMPKMGYDRQDRLEDNRSSLSISLVLKLLNAAGVNRINSLDIHSPQSAAGEVDRKDFMYGSNVLAAALRRTMPENPLVVALDKGTTARSQAYRGMLEITNRVPSMDKARIKGKVTFSSISSSVKGFDVIAPDDVISSGSSSVDGGKFLKDHGARSVTIVATHGEFTGRWRDYFDDDAIDRVLITDSIKPRDEILNHPKIEVYSLAPLLSEAIYRTFYKKNISELFASTAPEEHIIRLNPR